MQGVKYGVKLAKYITQMILYTNDTILEYFSALSSPVLSQNHSVTGTTGSVGALPHHQAGSGCGEQWGPGEHSPPVAQGPAHTAASTAGTAPKWVSPGSCWCSDPELQHHS